MHVGRPSPSVAPRQAGWPRSLGAVTRWREAARAGLQAAYAAAQGAEAGATAVKDAVTDRAEAAAGVASQVAHVPADVAREVRRELDAWWRGVAKTLAGALAVGALGLFALVVLTVGAVVLLNARLGDPYGTLIVGAVYVLAAFLGLVWTARTKDAAQDEAAVHGEHAAQAMSLHPPEAVLDERRAAQASAARTRESSPPS